MLQSIFCWRHLTSRPQLSALVKPLEFRCSSFTIKLGLFLNQALHLWELSNKDNTAHAFLYKAESSYCMLEIEGEDVMWACGGRRRRGTVWSGVCVFGLYQYCMHWASRGCIAISSCQISVMQPVTKPGPWRAACSLDWLSCPDRENKMCFPQAASTTSKWIRVFPTLSLVFFRIKVDSLWSIGQFPLWRARLHCYCGVTEKGGTPHPATGAIKCRPEWLHAYTEDRCKGRLLLSSPIGSGFTSSTWKRDQIQALCKVCFELWIRLKLGLCHFVYISAIPC